MVLETKIYVSENGFSPFIEWIESLDGAIRQRIKQRLDSLLLGNFGDSKALKSGLYELRCHFGAGYRIYYGITQGKIVLLCGGDKQTQKKDVKEAKQLWQDYGARNEMHNH